MTSFPGLTEYQNLIKELKKKIYHPIYFFMGEETYYMDKLTEYFETEILSESEKVFNQLVFYGRDSDVVNIINAARRYPMAANYQVVVIKEAQDLKEIQKLVFYVERPMPSTILVINYKYGKLASNTKLFKALSKFVLIDFPKLKDYHLSSWIIHYLRHKNIEIAPTAAELLADCIGNNLTQIVHELDKLLLVLPSNIKTITKEHIEKNVGITKDFNIYELEKAVGQKNIPRAMAIAKYFSMNPKNHPLIVTIGSLFNYFSRLLICHALKNKTKESIANALGVSPYIASEYLQVLKNYSLSKVVSIISLLREYDIKSKGIGVNIDDDELLKELLYKILH